MVSLKRLVGYVALGLMSFVPVTLAQGAPPKSEQDSVDKMVDEIKNPVEWFNWGMDLRIREEVFKNNAFFQDHQNDNYNVWRFRGRIWTEIGPFFGDKSINTPNGLSVYARLVYEPRVYTAKNSAVITNNADWNEIAWDNLYAKWVRPGGLPLSFTVGRQDMTYGRGWIIMDGTPLDGSRSIYNDAIKATIYLDDIKSELDLFGINNKARESRIEPLKFDDTTKFTSEFDANLLGAYFKSFYFKPMEFNAYYIYKDESLHNPTAPAIVPVGRIVHTAGGLIQGTLPQVKEVDYYVEAAYQWGKEGSQNRSAYGFNSDVGYTFNVDMSPRVHAGYEFLSGAHQGPNGTYTGWDGVLSRWPQWSELWANHWKAEGGQPGLYTNLQRINLGASAKPIPKMGVFFDYDYLLGNTHPFGKGATATPLTYGSGDTRGHFFAGKLTYDFCRYASGHLWAEYFIPDNYYASSSANAYFLRWEVTFKF